MAWSLKKTVNSQKRLPGIRDTGSQNFPVSRIPGSWDSPVSGSHKFPVSGTPKSRFWTVHCFFQTSGHFLHPSKQQSIKKQCGSNIYYTRTFGSYFQNFPNFIISLVTPGVHMYITPWKFAKNENGSRMSLIGPGGAVWWKKPDFKNLMLLSL